MDSLNVKVKDWKFAIFLKLQEDNMEMTGIFLPQFLYIWVLQYSHYTHSAWKTNLNKSKCTNKDKNKVKFSWISYTAINMSTWWGTPKKLKIMQNHTSFPSYDILTLLLLPYIQKETWTLLKHSSMISLIVVTDIQIMTLMVNIKNVIDKPRRI